MAAQNVQEYSLLESFIGSSNLGRDETTTYDYEIDALRKFVAI